MALTKVIGAGLGEVTESSSLTYANSQASIVVQDDTNPNIVINDTGQSKDYFIVAQGSQLAFNYADGGGSSSASNVTQLMSMDNSGAITKPNQPAFSADLTAQQTNLPTGQFNTINFDNEIYDQNADFNTSTKTFTAPVTGRYMLSANMYFLNLDIDASYYQIELLTSNRAYLHVLSPKFAQDMPYYTANISICADMDASDTAYVRVYQAGGAAQTDINAGSHFSGFLVA
jgi:hypothetical protein